MNTETPYKNYLDVEPKPHLLRQLANFIEKLPPEKLDMSHFCGSSRCALGWAPSVKAIEKAGLYIGPDPYAGGGPSIRVRGNPLEKINVHYETDHGNFRSGEYEKASAVFGISDQESTLIFGGMYTTNEDVARSLREVANHYDGRGVKK